MGSTRCLPERKPGRRCFSLRFIAPLTALTIFTASGIVRADNKAKGPDFSKGALYGTVVNTVTGKPLADATVAIVLTDGKVITWTKTNAEGKYALAADAISTLHLRPSHRRSLLEEVCRGVGNVVMAPVKVAVGAVSRPGETVKSAVEPPFSVIPRR